MGGELWGEEMNNNKLPNTHTHSATRDYLLISSISHNSVWWSVAAERQPGRWISVHTYLPTVEEETEVL